MTTSEADNSEKLIAEHEARNARAVVVYLIVTIGGVAICAGMAWAKYLAAL